MFVIASSHVVGVTHADSRTEVTPAQMRPARVLSIAGSDSGGGAGVQADLKTLLAFGVFGTTAITAVTSQNTHGVQSSFEVPSEHLASQIAAVLSDIGADAIKTGMLPSSQSVDVVAGAVTAARASSPHLPLVVDPVLVSTSGHNLTDGGVVWSGTAIHNAALLPEPFLLCGTTPKRIGRPARPSQPDFSALPARSHPGPAQMAALRSRLLPLATVLTPNLPEAAALLGDSAAAGAAVSSTSQMLGVARALSALGPAYVLLKGGHLPDTEDAADILVRSSDGAHWVLSGARVRPALNTHGTGCTLAAALAAGLARGLSPEASAAAAKAFVADVIRRSSGLPLGSGVQRPMDHGVRLLRVSVSAATPSAPAPGDAGGGGGGAAAAPAAAGPLEQQQLQQQQQQPAPRANGILNPALYAITTSRAGAPAAGGGSLAWRDVLRAVEAAVAGGATCVQLREKHIDGADFVELATAAVAFCRPRGVAVIVNDRLDVAVAADADGAHIGQTDIPAAEARRILGPARILGVSVKTPELARAAVAAGADYVGSGACFPTGTKDSSVIGLDGLARVCEAVGADFPVVAIGGLCDGRRVTEAIARGAAGAAVVTAVFGQPDVAAAAAALRAEAEAALAAARRAAPRRRQ